MGWFAGLDWGGAQHAVCVVDDKGGVVDRFEVGHDEAGLAKRLRQAITTWADNSRHSSEWAASVYRRARQRGCDHPHATRILARAWVRVLWRAWVSKTPYDPAQHGGAKRLTQAAA